MVVVKHWRVQRVGYHDTPYHLFCCLYREPPRQMMAGDGLVDAGRVKLFASENVAQNVNDFVWYASVVTRSFQTASQLHSSTLLILL